MEILGFILVTFIDLLGAVILSLSIANPKLKFYSVSFKAGIVLMMIGLIGQALRNIIYLSTGNSPTDAQLPIWALKDIGITLVCVSWLWHKVKGDHV